MRWVCREYCSGQLLCCLIWFFSEHCFLGLKTQCNREAMAEVPGEKSPAGCSVPVSPIGDCGLGSLGNATPYPPPPPQYCSCLTPWRRLIVLGTMCAHLEKAGLRHEQGRKYLICLFRKQVTLSRTSSVQSEIVLPLSLEKVTQSLSLCASISSSVQWGQ